MSENFSIKIYHSSRLMAIYRKIPFGVPLANPAIRAVLRTQFLGQQIKANLYCYGKEKAMAEWYEKINLFFGLAIIRTGTTFLANLLNNEAKKAFVQQEAVLADDLILPKAYQNEHSTLNYLQDFRKKEIFYLASQKPITAYGEINPFLRRTANNLRIVFPQAKIFHIIRDGREVVRSIMSRSTFTDKDPFASQIKPPVNSPYRAKWPRMSRLEKVCWLWASDNRYLRKDAGDTLKFEKLIADYNYFKEKLLDYLGLDISQSAWQKYKNWQVNASPKYKMPAFSQWSKQEKDIFWQICGDEMRANGYQEHP